MLDAFVTAIEAELDPQGFATVARNPEWDEVPPALPAAAVYDGPEEVQELELGTLLVTMNVAVELRAVKPTMPALMTELNRLRALVRAAIGADPTLGGEALHTRYLGSDQPQVADLEQSPREGTLELNFAIERREAELDPYRSV